MKSLIFALVMAVVPSVFAAQGVYGTWGIFEYASGDLRWDIDWIVADHSVTARTTCRRLGGKSVTVSVTSPATISANHLIVLSSLEARTKPAADGTQCISAINAVTLEYAVSADDKRLILTEEDGLAASYPRK